MSVKVVTTAKISERHQQNLRALYPQMEFSFHGSLEDAVESLRFAEALITYGEDLTEEIILNRCPQLRWIQVISAGLELMPFKAIADRGIIVTNARGIHQIPMAEFTMGAMLQITRRTKELYRLQHAKEWDRSIRTEELNGKTIGIIGAGAIGSKIAQYAATFGMRVLGMNRSGMRVDHIDEMFSGEKLSELLQQSDFVVVIVPLTENTYQLIGEKEFAAMKKTAHFINLSRGTVVDEQALVRALTEKQIAGAVLDVFVQEPLPSNHPFWEMDNVTVTPHLSSRSPQYMERALELFKANATVFLTNSEQWINRIDPRKGY